MSAIAPSEAEVVYPDSDGQPMSDNTRQYRWITKLKAGLDIVYRGRPSATYTSGATRTPGLPRTAYHR